MKVVSMRAVARKRHYKICLIANKLKSNRSAKIKRVQFKSKIVSIAINPQLKQSAYNGNNN